jgi:hypothetical protein
VKPKADHPWKKTPVAFFQRRLCTICGKVPRTVHPSGTSAYCARCEAAVQRSRYWAFPEESREKDRLRAKRRRERDKVGIV